MVNKLNVPQTADLVDVLGVYVHVIACHDLIEAMIVAAKTEQKTIVSNINVHAVNLAIQLPWYRDFLNRSDYVFCDGFGIKWAAAFLKGKILERYTPPDWVPDFGRRCAEENLAWFFLGGQPGVAKQAAVQLQAGAPGLCVAGCHHGYFDKRTGYPENSAVIEQINSSGAEILFVGFGMPAQEKWLIENLPALNVRVALPVGAMFDYLAGATRRAPRWMTDHGLEWLGRLVIEPGRLWKRYILGNPLFIYRVLLQKFGLLRFK